MVPSKQKKTSKKPAARDITEEEFRQAPSGTIFTAPDGTVRTKP